VTFAPPTAHDEETPPTVTCDHPSGSTFAIGMTTVTCSATDTDDVPSSASSSFTITVNGALTQMTNLLTFVTPLPPGHSLRDGMQAAINDYNANKLSNACTDLKNVIKTATAQAGKALTVSQANMIIADAKQIEAVIGCT
jgi:hypothetical protein